MTTPRRSVQDAEKANETVAWQALPCRYRGSRPKTEKLALAHVFSSSRRNGARRGFYIVTADRPCGRVWNGLFPYLGITVHVETRLDRTLTVRFGTQYLTVGECQRPQKTVAVKPATAGRPRRTKLTDTAATIKRQQLSIVERALGLMDVLLKSRNSLARQTLGGLLLRERWRINKDRDQGGWS